MKNFTAILLVSALALSPAFAQSGTTNSSAEHQGNMNGMDMSAHRSGPMTKGMGHMMGMHMMPATVTSVDAKTGMVEATAEGMSLKVHFPPTALANVKNGDKITLHLSFTKP